MSTPPAAAPTPRTDAVNECAKRLILNRPFGSSTADLLQELADLYSKHAESLERFLGSALANNDPLREKVIEFQRELAAKDARIAALEKDRDEFHGQYRMKCDVETKTLHIELADLRAQLQAANAKLDAAHAENERLAVEADRWMRDWETATDAAKAAINLVVEKEQANAALKAEVERLTKERDDFHHSYRTKCDIETKALHNELTAARALNDTLAGALKYNDAILQTIQVNAGDGNLVDIVSARTGNAVALSAYAKSKEAQP